jgi:hypothetical protein
LGVQGFENARDLGCIRFGFGLQPRGEGSGGGGERAEEEREASTRGGRAARLRAGAIGLDASRPRPAARHAPGTLSNRISMHGSGGPLVANCAQLSAMAMAAPAQHSVRP